MPDTWLGRYSRYVEKLFNVKGGPALVDLNPSVQGFLQMNVPPVEERYLVGIESFGAGDNQPAVAANNSAFMIRNPTSSNIICVVEKLIVCSTAGASGITLAVAGSNPADLANAVPNHSRADPRSRNIGSCVVTRDAPAINPGTGFLQIALFNVASGVPFDIILTPNHEIVLLPQIALRVIATVVNFPLQCTIFFRERPLESSELN